MISARVCVVLYSFRWLLLFCVTLYQNMYSIVCVCVCEHVYGYFGFGRLVHISNAKPCKQSTNMEDGMNSKCKV